MTAPGYVIWRLRNLASHPVNDYQNEHSAVHVHSDTTFSVGAASSLLIKPILLLSCSSALVVSLHGTVTTR